MLSHKGTKTTRRDSRGISLCLGGSAKKSTERRNLLWKRH